jgi:hypothetical protein
VVENRRRAGVDAMSDDTTKLLSLSYKFIGDIKLHGSSISVYPDENHLIICSMSFSGAATVLPASLSYANADDFPKDWTLTIEIGEYSDPAADDTAIRRSSFSLEKKEIKLILDTQFFIASNPELGTRNYIPMLQPWLEHSYVQGTLTIIDTPWHQVKIDRIHFSFSRRPINWGF